MPFIGSGWAYFHPPVGLPGDDASSRVTSVVCPPRVIVSRFTWNSENDFSSGSSRSSRFLVTAASRFVGVPVGAPAAFTATVSGRMKSVSCPVGSTRRT